MQCQLKQNGRWQHTPCPHNSVIAEAEAQLYDIESDSEYSDINDLSSDPDDSWRYLVDRGKIMKDQTLLNMLSTTQDNAAEEPGDDRALLPSRRPKTAYYRSSPSRTISSSRAKLRHGCHDCKQAPLVQRLTDPPRLPPIPDCRARQPPCDLGSNPRHLSSRRLRNETVKVRGPPTEKTAAGATCAPVCLPN
ncbi:hypothetical protein DFH94DRAFT_197997 [Russula ochroleuca]|jgi:hypothetical protein|uniref:Uncharacterized protein n=1 Tax=Russula ochroleuca TaxID=152965 RepID=A0A9P5MMS2_9AGAM|nr:hypothetical protein DFH94DRAFT_197997 [Russula ochroleuca]